MRVGGPTQLSCCCSLLIYQHFSRQLSCWQSDSPSSLNGLATSFRKDARAAFSEEARDEYSNDHDCDCGGRVSGWRGCTTRQGSAATEGGAGHGGASRSRLGGRCPPAIG